MQFRQLKTKVKTMVNQIIHLRQIELGGSSRKIEHPTDTFPEPNAKMPKVCKM
jgi:hypothetical protein